MCPDYPLFLGVASKSAPRPSTYVDPAQWFVSKNGNNTTGTSWATAWNELNQINWASINPGDTIAVDGGPTRCSNLVQGYDFVSHSTARPGVQAGMVYTTQLAPTASGTAGHPITIRASRESGHDGTVVFFGGRTTLLPEAGSSGYVAGGGVPLTIGVDLTGRSYITIDGLRRSGIVMYGYGDVQTSVAAYATQLGGTGWGVRLTSTTTNVILRNLEIFDCGTYGQVTVDSTWKSDQPGIKLGGDHITIDRCLIHDCGQDPIQADQVLTNLTLSSTWLYGRRFHSTWSGFGFNSGDQGIAAQNTTHVDGIQAFGTGLNQGPVTVDHCMAGPLLNQGFYFANGTTATFDAVSFSNVTMMAPFRHGIQADNSGTTSTPANWAIDHCTAHGPSTSFGTYASQWMGIETENGSGHSITNTIVTWGADIFDVTKMTGTCSGNIYSGTGATAMPGGTSLDPLFNSALTPTNNAPTWAQYTGLDLTPTAAGAIGKGSDLTSIQTLLNRIDSLNG